MMRQVGGSAPPAESPLARQPFRAPFPGGLEYGAPARGVWNIVHAGMLVAQAHEIYVCAQGCLRGVVLTAAEMGASARFSTVTIEEHDLYDGDMESLLIEGVTDILQRLPMLPPAVLVYSSCVHHFMATDLALCYRGAPGTLSWRRVYRLLHESDYAQKRPDAGPADAASALQPACAAGAGWRG